MAQNHEGVINEIRIAGMTLRPDADGEYTRAAGAPAIEHSTKDYIEPAVRETISATKAFDSEMQPPRSTPAVIAPERDGSSTVEKMRRSIRPLIRGVGKTALYAAYAAVIVIPPIAIYNAGHGENINSPADIIPAITQTWHEASALNPFGGGQ